MTVSARDNYLATEVLTATPQKLQLMLIEAAIRLGQQTLVEWQAGREEQAAESLVRCQQIVTELICGLNPEKDADLVRRMGGVYLFVFRSLIAAHVERSEAKLGDALRVLEVERETWQMICQQLGTRRDEPAQDGAALALDA